MDGLPSYYDGFKFTSLTKMDFLKMKFEVKTFQFSLKGSKFLFRGDLNFERAPHKLQIPIKSTKK
jgi:hypothetical protein